MSSSASAGTVERLPRLHLLPHLLPLLHAAERWRWHALGLGLGLLLLVFVLLCKCCRRGGPVAPPAAALAEDSKWGTLRDSFGPAFDSAPSRPASMSFSSTADPYAISMQSGRWGSFSRMPSGTSSRWGSMSTVRGPDAFSLASSSRVLL